MKKLKKIVFVLFSIGFFCGFVCVAINIYMVQSTKKYIYDENQNFHEKYVVIVPGAKVYTTETVSFVFRDRIECGVNLLKNGKVQKILISGDHGRKNYDEVNAAKKYIQTMHILDQELIFLDHAGFSTYETMYRARDVFCVTNAIITTQKFHIYRSVYIAKKLGLDVIGVVAPEINKFPKNIHISWEIREFFARVKAFFFVAFDIKPTFLGDKIPITGNGSTTWD